MKSTKLIVIISKIWNEEQLEASKTCLIRGLEQINKKFPNDNLFSGIQDCDFLGDIKLDNCAIEVVINADKDGIINSFNEGLKNDNLILLYVGEVTVPFGQWILQDGIFNSNSLYAILDSGHHKTEGNIMLVTPSPCEDWQVIEKKQLPYFSFCGYGLEQVDETDEFASRLTGFVEAVSGKLSISQVETNQKDSMLAAISTHSPSLYLFLDKGSACCPALLTLDGFAMLLNYGFSRNAEWRRYVKYYQQIDVGLMSHLAYSNLLGLEAYASTEPDLMDQRISHMFIPGEVAIIDHRPASVPNQCSTNPFHVDLKTKLGTMLTKLKASGMQMSNLAVKAKSGSALTANQIKPIQLFYKIGYGSLEMVPLCPFEDDVDMKKFHDDWKKSKYCNDNLAKTLPSSAAVLLIWKPFSSKAPIKRIIYIGSKCPVKRNFPSMITALHSTFDFLKQAEYAPLDGLVKKPLSARKTTPPVSAAGASRSAPSKSSDNASTNAKKPAPPVEKPSRPITVSAPPAHAAKDLPGKRPQTATGGKPKPEPAKPHEPIKKAATQPNTGKAVTNVPHNSAPKKQQPLAPSNKKAIDTKSQIKEPGAMKFAKPKVDKAGITNGAHHQVDNETHGGTVDIKHVTDMDTVSNGDAHPDNSVVMDTNGEAVDVHPAATAPDTAGSIVAVGTVECAITEHGEADFCDDTPEEITADQMREMGLYDDNEKEEEKGRAGSNPDGDGGVVNIAHLPMEGSFYGKEALDGDSDGNLHGNMAVDWNQPLAMPMPVKEVAVVAGNAGKKSGGKSSPAIYVDCLCVPCDLDKEDLRYLFDAVKAAMIYLQLEKPADLSKAVELLLEEREKEGVANAHDTKVVPSNCDDSCHMWAAENIGRLESCRVTIGTDLSRCLISTFGGGDQANPAGGCHGIKWEF